MSQLILGLFLFLTLLAGCGGRANDNPGSDENSLTFSILYDGTPSQSSLMNLDCSTMGISTITAKISALGDGTNATYDLGCVQNGKISNLQPTTHSNYGLRIDGKDASGEILYSSYINGFGLTNGDLGTIILTYVGPEQAKNVTYDSATLSSRFTNPSGVTITVWFEYGTSNAYGSTITPQAFAAAGQYTITADITGLSSRTTYQYRLAKQTSLGTTYGPAISFTTLAAPETVGTVSDTELAALTRTGSSATTRAYDSTYVYYIEGGVIKKAPIGGGTVTTLTVVLNNPTSIAVDSSSIFFLESGSGPPNNDGAMKKMGLNGGAITVLASGLYWPTAFAMDSSNVYIADAMGLKKVGINGGVGGVVITLPSGNIGISNLAVDSESVYILGWGGNIEKVSLNGGTVTTLATGHAYQGWGQILVDSDYVYFVDNVYDIYNGSNFVPYGVKKISKNGGVVITLSSTGGWWNIDGFDTNYVYFDQYGTLYRVPK